MKEQLVRTALLVGEEGIRRLQEAHVAVFGVGGVGGYVVESLVRSGVGTIDIIDKDVVDESNINRQLVANHNTVGKMKVEIMKERLLSYNPEVVVNAYPIFFLPDTADQFDFKQYDYVIDAIDTVTAKLELIGRCNREGVPIISCMGAGNKLDSSQFQIADLYESSICPLAKVMRRECKKRGIDHVKVLFSKEQPVTRGEVPGSTAFAPAVAGLLIAEEVFRELSGNSNT